MKTAFLLALVGSSLLMSSGCQKAGEITPAADLTTGRILRVEQTTDGQGQNSRLRWVVDIAPIMLPGRGNRLYPEAKVFTLSDTAVYRTGRMIRFHYQLVPYAQQTPWVTVAERFDMSAAGPWASMRPEITVTDAQVVN